MKCKSNNLPARKFGNSRRDASLAMPPCLDTIENLSRTPPELHGRQGVVQAVEVPRGCATISLEQRSMVSCMVALLRCPED